MQFNCIVIRSTWDYYEKETAFNIWLEKIQSLGIKTLNALETIQYNKHKFYLKELEQKGINILSTLFINKNTNTILSNLIPAQWKKIVIKPAFSAGSYLTECFDIEDTSLIQEKYTEHFKTKDFLIQEFKPEIKTLGETSFIFFNRKFSHAIVKKPTDGDFRVQYQYGGKYHAIQPDNNLINQAKQVVDLIDGNLLYARVDGIIIDNQLNLMEIELIEPDLYFDLAKGSRERFVQEIVNLTRLN